MISNIPEQWKSLLFNQLSINSQSLMVSSLMNINGNVFKNNFHSSIFKDLFVGICKYSYNKNMLQIRILFKFYNNNGKLKYLFGNIMSIQKSDPVLDIFEILSLECRISENLQI